MPNVTKAQIAEREALAEQGLKRCGACSEILSVDAFGLQSRKSWDGLRGVCKSCRKAEGTRYYTEHRDAMLAKGRARYSRDRDKILQRHKRYRGSVVQHCDTTGCGNRAQSNSEGSLCSRCLWRRDHWGTVDESGRPKIEWPSGEAHYAWKGDSIGYSTAHARTQRVRGKATECSCTDCGQQASEWSYRGGSTREVVGPNSQGVVMAYSPDPDDYEPRCIPCHRVFDLDRRREGISV